MYKSAILKVDELEPIQKGPKEALLVGDLVQRKSTDAKQANPPMRVVQMSGVHVLVNYLE
jgi:hypothetical protein